MCVLLQSVDKLLAQAGEGFVKVLKAQEFLCKYDASDRVERLLGKVRLPLLLVRMTNAVPFSIKQGSEREKVRLLLPTVIHRVPLNHGANGDGTQ